MKKANNLIFFFLRIIFIPALFLLYRFLFEQKTSKGIKRPCLYLANHQTSFDQFAAGMGFKFAINYVATDTIFRHGLLSKLMVLLTNPIPFSKGSSDLAAVKNMISVIKDGGCVGMFPSGNKSFYGEESFIVPGIGKLAKKLNVPVVLVQIRGGFFTKARWMIKPSKGKMRAAVVRVIQKEELQTMSADEVDKAIFEVLNFNDFEYNKKAQIPFHGKRKAEYLESVLFYCPECESLKDLYSKGCEFYCKNCGASVKINDFGFFEKVKNAEKIPDTILEWSYKQLDFIKNYDYSNKQVFKDDNVCLYKAQRAKKEELLAKGSIEFYADKLVVCEKEFLFTEITMAAVGVRKLTIYSKDGVYAIVSPYRINLVKYMICGYHLRNKALGIKEEFYGY